MHTGKLREFTELPTWLPHMPETKKIIVVPREVIYNNLAAAPTANIIRLVHREEEMTLFK